MNQNLLQKIFQSSLDFLNLRKETGRTSEIQIMRDRIDRCLGDMATTIKTPFKGPILVDAMWDNPNYWLCYTFLRIALGLANTQEVGLLGDFRQEECTSTLSHFGFEEIIKFRDFFSEQDLAHRQAQQFLQNTQTPNDILNWQLPDLIPAYDVYDYLLKRQRNAIVDLQDIHLESYITEYFRAIQAARVILDRVQPKLVVMSHASSGATPFGPLMWMAISRNILVLVPRSDYGLLRFWKFYDAEDVYARYQHLTGELLESLPENKADILARVGRDYLTRRLTGKTTDPASVYAFQRASTSIERENLIKTLNWNLETPIIAVYASTWFDNPHVNNMKHFRDFVDWLTATVLVAKENDRVNWLFKPHPRDDYYGNITLKDMMPAVHADNIHLVPKEWNGKAVMNCVDALVTYHGTAGIEYAAAGKPVLVADRGWYHDCGFVKLPRSREEYLQILKTSWWQEFDLQTIARRAQIFAGWNFGKPLWQGNFQLSADSEQDKIYPTIPNLLSANQDAFEKEISTIYQWYYSNSRLYHTFKMEQANDYQSVNF
ncbi:MAG: glycosyltransferase [Cyanobacteria bacterium P01_E01_bin.42]